MVIYTICLFVSFISVFVSSCEIVELVNEMELIFWLICSILQFFEELVLGNDSGQKQAELPRKPLNKKIKFSYSDSSGSDDDGDDDEHEEDKEDDESASHIKDNTVNDDARAETLDSHKDDGTCPENQAVAESNGNKEVDESHENRAKETEDPPAKKQCLETNVSESLIPAKVEEKSIDKLIDDEIKELGDTNKVC